MSIETNYEPKYITLDDVPISGPDDYTMEEKRRAIFSAESELELDVNGGERIPERELLDGHRTAVMNHATHTLTHAAQDPADVTIGDMASGDTGGGEYSSRYLENYREIVDKLTSVTEGSSRVFSTAVNVGDAEPDGVERRQHFDRDHEHNEDHY